MTDKITERERAELEARVAAAEARYEGQKSALTKALGELRAAEERAVEAERLLAARQVIHDRDIDELIGILGKPAINRARELSARCSAAEAEAKRLREALRGLESRYEPGVFCDHAAEPCPRCEAARLATKEPDHE